MARISKSPHLKLHVLCGPVPKLQRWALSPEDDSNRHQLGKFGVCLQCFKYPWKSLLRNLARSGACALRLG
jgi:hypothetical protein